jgi:CheY-like chemotaxis protein
MDNPIRRNMLSGLRLLIVDDELDNIVPMEYALRFGGGTVTSISDSSEALAILSEGKVNYHIFLLDLQMPIVSGFEVVRHIRHLEAYQDATCIAVTAMVREEDKENSLSAGFDGVITKPFDLAMLVSEISRIHQAKQESLANR